MLENHTQSKGSDFGDLSQFQIRGLNKSEVSVVVELACTAKTFSFG